jgi:hypothetical protein
MQKYAPMLLLVVSVAIVSAWTVSGQGVKPVQTWEYKALVYNVSGSSGTLYEDGKPVSGTPISRAPELGAQGWELITMTALQIGSVNPSPQYLYWFKRPR